jgi:hypothetical protein
MPSVVSVFVTASPTNSRLFWDRANGLDSSGPGCFVFQITGIVHRIILYSAPWQIKRNYCGMSCNFSMPLGLNEFIKDLISGATTGVVGAISSSITVLVIAEDGIVIHLV